MNLSGWGRAVNKFCVILIGIFIITPTLQTMDTPKTLLCGLKNVVVESTVTGEQFFRKQYFDQLKEITLNDTELEKLGLSREKLNHLAELPAQCYGTDIPLVKRVWLTQQGVNK